MPPRLLARREQGVTLLETLIATTIVTLIILGAGAIFFHSINVQRNAERISFANNLARQQIELTKARGYANITVGTTAYNTPDGQFRVTTTVTNDLDSLGRPRRTKTITVTAAELAGARATLAMHRTTVHQRGI